MTRRHNGQGMHATPSGGQGRSWIIAAVLVVMVSAAVAVWLRDTARKADRDALARSAVSVMSSIEEEIRLIDFVTQGAQGVVGESLAVTDLIELSRSVDAELIRVIAGLARYPVVDGKVSEGSRVWGLASTTAEAIPAFDLTVTEIIEAASSDDALLSPPRLTDSGTTYAMLRPAVGDEGQLAALVGLVFSADRLLADSLAGEGEGTAAGILRDVRFEDIVVADHGEVAGRVSEHVTIGAEGGAWRLTVRPGPDFGFAQSLWVPAAVVIAGLVIALLLVRMAWMARARSLEMNERLQLAQALNRSKDEFLASVSHELRTPLTVVLGMAQEMSEGWDAFAVDERGALLELMSEQAQEAANIVEDLLVAARSDSGTLLVSMEPTELTPHVGYALSLIPPDQRQRVEWQPVEQPLAADPTRLRQILRNLLDNAIRYGGPRVRVSSWEAGDRVHIAVEDNGAPISEGAAALLFEPYERLHEVESETPSGVGIGLHVSRLLARLMGGELVWSYENGFNRFIVNVPAVHVRPSQATHPPAGGLQIAATTPLDRS